MALETATYINGLNASNPTATDPKSQGDDHIRLLKATVKATFPNIDGAVTASDEELNILDGATLSTAELNILDGVTADFEEINVLDGISVTTNDINALGRKDGETYTGAHDFTGATVDVPTLAYGSDGNSAASVEYVNQASFQAELPAQTGKNGFVLVTDGTTATWTPFPHYLNLAQGII